MLTIIIPAYNAERIIGATLDDYLLYFSKQYDQDFEVLVVTNGCSDMTASIVAEYCDRFPNIRQESFEGKIGKGGAVIEGFKAASGDLIGFVDADNATRPPDLHKIVREMGDSGGAIGSRWLPSSNVLVRQPLSRRIASRGFNFLIGLFFRLPFADTQCGAKVFKKEAVDQVVHELRTPGFAFDVDLLYRVRQKGYEVREIPITWQDSERSTLDLKATVPTMFLALLRLRLFNSPARAVIENKFVTSLYRRIWMGRRLIADDRRTAKSGKEVSSDPKARSSRRFLTSPAKFVKRNRVVAYVYNYVGSRR